MGDGFQRLGMPLQPKWTGFWPDRFWRRGL